VNATLRNYSPHREELEFAALGIIHWNQIIGWQRVERGGLGRFVPNPDYSIGLYSGLHAAGAQPQLAGFPAGHPAWRVQPWLQFANCELRSSCFPVETAEQVGYKWFNQSQGEIIKNILISISLATNN
ncbi:hypothetical protein AB2M45_003354, partial [Vibrio cholerae]